MHAISQMLANRIVSGLARRSITKCSEWAERYRVLGSDTYSGPWRFPSHPWLEDMHNSDAEMNIGQKAAQMGYTETVLNRVLFNMDIKNLDCLYILPNWKPDASDFSCCSIQPGHRTQSASNRVVLRRR